MPVRFGSEMSPMIHISRETGSSVMMKIINAQAAKILANKFFNLGNLVATTTSSLLVLYVAS